MTVAITSLCIDVLCVLEHHWQRLGNDADWLVIDVTIMPRRTPNLNLALCDTGRIKTQVCAQVP